MVLLRERVVTLAGPMLGCWLERRESAAAKSVEPNALRYAGVRQSKTLHTCSPHPTQFTQLSFILSVHSPFHVLVLSLALILKSTLAARQACSSFSLCCNPADDYSSR